MQEIVQQLTATKQWIPSRRDQRQTFTNCYTFEEFEIRKVRNQKQNFSNLLNLRQQMPLPNTPKTFPVPFAGQQDETVNMLVQVGQYSVERMVSHFEKHQQNSLQIVLLCLTTAQMLHRRYGPFRFTDKMISVSKGPSIMLWISEDYMQSQPQFPIEGDNSQRQVKQMILSLLQILIDKIPQLPILKALLCQTCQGLSFDELKKSIQKQMKSPIQQIKKPRRSSICPERVPQFLLKKKLTHTSDRIKKIRYSESEPQITYQNRSEAATSTETKYSQTTNIRESEIFTLLDMQLKKVSECPEGEDQFWSHEVHQELMDILKA